MLETLEIEPQRVLFFDDNPVNVEAANSMGILGRQVCSFDQLKEELDGLGLTSG
ncbi:HAD-IA family hydrolase [Microbulbifer halophilus]|uniref:HAD-IA family hydrolase n=1 Tax=Microbulbifer halophilus TaxID=453963 RepID=A0ABW5EJQ5_9GAMM|nr:HAD-IA family hydrolase [Microbulbifer halophilus]MCW8126379.1 HAD-IA family hydrolase [Microbulbifer halophilus]